MPHRTASYIGWVQAFFSVLVLWGLNNVMLGYSAQILETNPIALTCILFSSSSFALLYIGGHGKLSIETLRSFDTWGYGLSLLALYILGIFLFKEVGATEGSFLQRISVLFSIIFGWFFFSRKPDLSQITGGLLIFLGICIVCYGIAAQKLATVLMIVLFWSFSHMTRVFVAEMHKTHSAAVEAKDPRSRCRVIGFIMFVVSMFFTIFILTLSTISQLGGEQTLPILPQLSDFMHPATVLVGIVLGIILMAPLRYLEFASANAIKAENVLAVTCFGSFATLFWEWFTQPITGLSLKEFTQTDMIAGVIITAGGLVMAIAQIRKSQKPTTWESYLQYVPQDIAQVEDSREILANTLEHFKSNIKKSAEALDLPVSVIEALLNDKDKALAFKDDMLKDVARRYRRNVALSDSLTGLANRAGFMTALKGAPYEAKAFSLIFIDLDKFKPINDTYGHDAGDFVLKTIAERLGKLFPKRSLITRLGGDEFCVLLLDHNKEQANVHTADIQRKICEPMEFNGNDFAVSASLGVASYPEDSTSAEELLKLADSGMYSEKKER